jgi:hypothetical protein
MKCGISMAAYSVGARPDAGVTGRSSDR